MLKLVIRHRNRFSEFWRAIADPRFTRPITDCHALQHRSVVHILAAVKREFNHHHGPWTQRD